MEAIEEWRNEMKVIQMPVGYTLANVVTAVFLLCLHSSTGSSSADTRWG